MLAQALLDRTELRRVAAAQNLDEARRTELGQVFTPAPVATFLASLLDLPRSGELRLLDPGAGVGSLTAAVVARAVRERPGLRIAVTTFEVDDDVSSYLSETLEDCRLSGAQAGVTLAVDARPEDFIMWAANRIEAGDRTRFDSCVMNPPYRKLSPRGSDCLALSRVGLRATNLYAAFVGLASRLLVDGGQLSAITPRSFANGPYFEPFRSFFLERMSFDRIHVFERREHVFSDSGVLQENLIFRATRGAPRGEVTLSSSRGFGDTVSLRTVSPADVVRRRNGRTVIHLPIDDASSEVSATMLRLEASLEDLGVEVSTGRVVDFRVRAALRMKPEPNSVPLVYPHNLRAPCVDWPGSNRKKATSLARTAATEKLLLPNETYVLVKRFTSKEERRRVVASISSPSAYLATAVAFENHLNVFHEGGKGLDPEFARGLTLFLNSTLVDEYVRQFSGHTQINATDLRGLRYPSIAQLACLGAAVQSRGWPVTQADVDAELLRHLAAPAVEERVATAS